MSYFNLKINWDFDSVSKSKYCFQEVETYCDLNFCLQNLDTPFFEINAKENIILCFSEALENKPLLIDNLKFPFIYFRNIGECNITINSSNTFCPYETNLLHKTSYISGFCNLDYLLKPKENIILSFCASEDGQFYFSQSQFPFGFFYLADLVTGRNPSGLYPVCCYVYYCEQIPAQLTGTGVCGFNYEIKCITNDYKWNFINYYYCWSGNFLTGVNEFENRLFYQTSVCGLIQSVIEYSTGQRDYIYCENDYTLIKNDQIIYLTGIYESQLNCYFSYENNVYDYNSEDFDDIIHENFINSGFIETGNFYLFTGFCCCTYQYLYSGYICNITYRPTFLYEDLDLNLLNQYSGTGYTGFIKSNYFSGHVDSGISLLISTENGCQNILDPIRLKSSNKNIDFCSEIYLAFEIENSPGSIITVDKDTELNILYKINSINKLFYKYCLDVQSQTNKAVEIYDSYGNFLFETNKKNNCFCFIKDSASDGDAFVKFNLCNLSTSGINLKNLNSCFYTFPEYSNFNYEYCFEIKNKNYDIVASPSGYWSSTVQSTQNCYSKNYINFICTGNAYYLNNKPNFYCIDLNVDDGEINFTNKMMDPVLATGFSNYFEVKKKNTSCIFQFCGVEYRYSPIDYLQYGNNKIYLPDSGICIHLHINNKSLNFNFPILALGCEQLLISSDITFKNLYSNFILDLCYNDFTLTSCKESMSKICIPRIKKYNSQSYEVPDLKLSFSSKRLLCENIKIKSLFITESLDTNNDLFNFHVYLASFFFLNSSDLVGISGLKYGSDDYNFKFLDLLKKINSLEETEELTVEACEIKQETFSGFTSLDVFPYKLCSGSCYSYASLILDQVQYCHVLDSKNIYFEKTGNLSQNHFGKSFDYGNCFYLYSCSGNRYSDLCYLNSGFQKNGYGQVGNSHFLIKISKENFTGVSGCISINNNFKITGTQPIVIKSDSRIESICGNLLYNNYIQYNDLSFKTICNNFDSLFYYTYPFSGAYSKDLCFKIKENCCVDYVEISFNDSGCKIENTFFNYDFLGSTGTICKNNLILTYPFECVICSNTVNSDDYLYNIINIITCQ
jgi:hypothetical protein